MNWRIFIRIFVRLNYYTFMIYTHLKHIQIYWSQYLRRFEKFQSKIMPIARGSFPWRWQTTSVSISMCQRPIKSLEALRCLADAKHNDVKPKGAKFRVAISSKVHTCTLPQLIISSNKKNHGTSNQERFLRHIDSGVAQAIGILIVPDH